MTAIVWLRRDLREYDNKALVEASKEHEKIIPFYVVDKNYFENGNLGYPRVKFWHEALKNLKQTLNQDDKDLIIRHGKPITEIKRLTEEVSPDAIYYNRDYTPYSRQRDQKLENLDTKTKSFKDLVMFEKREILTNSNDPYKVFTYYKKKWFEKEKPRPEKTNEYTVPNIDSKPIPSLDKLGFEKPDELNWQWQPNRKGAKKRLEDFKQKILSYDDDRDYAWKDSTSKLSPHLKFGTVSIREVFWEAERVKARNEGEDLQGVETWQEELAWRDFYMQLLWNYPETTDKAMQEQFRSLEWKSREDYPEIWEKFLNGKTGFPFVDAGMRQLKRTGWMHNRLRMVVTSFACKDLWLDWRDLHEYFNKKFVDAEKAAMVGGIQWAYSIGTDAQPYFRVFNPWTQGEKFDPEGEYIRKYVPELEDVPDEHIHKPFEMPEEIQINSDCKIGDDYPKPIVDHSEKREIAIEKFEQARND